MCLWIVNVGTYSTQAALLDTTLTGRHVLDLSSKGLKVAEFSGPRTIWRGW